MADLPTIPTRPLTVTAPTTRVSPQQIASPYVEFAEILQQGAKDTGELAERLAHDAGLQAVTRDENGNIQVEHAPIIGKAAIAYKNAIQMKAVTEGEDIVKTDMLAMRHKFQDDPEGFRKAAAVYARDKTLQFQKAAGPDVGLAIERITNNTAREFHEGLLNRKESLDLQRAKSSIEVQIETAKN